MTAMAPGGTYRTRFMPDVVGTWRYVTHSSIQALAGKEGTFSQVEPGDGNRGAVSAP